MRQPRQEAPEYKANQFLLEHIVNITRAAFANPNFDEQDIYEHFMAPEVVALIKSGEAILGFAGYNRFTVGSRRVLSVEGIALHPQLQRHGIFASVTNMVARDETSLCLRTQNMNMYRALANYCHRIFPGAKKGKQEAIGIAQEYSTQLGCEVGNDFIARGCYSEQLYGSLPTKKVRGLATMKPEQGDGVIAVGFL